MVVKYQLFQFIGSSLDPPEVMVTREPKLLAEFSTGDSVLPFEGAILRFPNTKDFPYGHQGGKWCLFKVTNVFLEYGSVISNTCPGAKYATVVAYLNW